MKFWAYDTGEIAMNYQEAMEYMEKVGTYGIVPGLDSIRELCRRLGNPQEELKFVHIAGTNGKGSTLAYISSILQAAGYRVGKYISPVIIEYCEKIQIGKQKITHKDLCEGLEIIKKHCDAMVSDGFHHPTPFEIETALAFWYFREKQCDIVVLETGMGGREDATNLITTTQVAVLASIGMDHMKFLGNSLEEIATHKTGICKPGCQVVSMRQKEAAQKVVEQTAAELGCILTMADAANAKHVKYGLKKQTFDYENYKKLEITLAGKFQVANAVPSCAPGSVIFWHIPPQSWQAYSDPQPCHRGYTQHELCRKKASDDAHT
jgi:dihydrofolate synthase / folylpolyglutamate synthase